MFPTYRCKQIILLSHRLHTGSLPTMEGEEDSSPLAQFAFKFNQQTQILLDRTAPLILPRWVAWLVSLLAYVLRVTMLKGFYIVTYGLGIYNLNLLLGFITPQVDPELEEGPELPTKSDQEFKPFVRRLPEFKFW